MGVNPFCGIRLLFWSHMGQICEEKGSHEESCQGCVLVGGGSSSEGTYWGKGGWLELHVSYPLSSETDALLIVVE